MAPVQTASLADGAVLSVLLDQPRGNILSTEMMRALEDALDAHANQQHLKLVLLRGSGNNFSFGASVPEHRAASAPEMLRTFHRLVRRVANYPVPIASVVEGRCLGGAFELVLATHFVFVTEKTVFACPELKLGVFPPVLSVLGPLRLGGALSERLLLTGAELDAAKALHCGFVSEVIPAETDLQAWMLAWYHKHLAPLSAFSLREATWASRNGAGIIRNLREPLDEAEQRYLQRLLQSHDGNEGIEAFLAKRTPVWVDA